MKTIEYFTNEELKKLPNPINYFFEGSNGFWKRNYCSPYVTSADNLVEELRMNNALELATYEEHKNLLTYLGEMRERILKDINQSEKRIIDLKEQLVNIRSVGSVISHENSMKKNYELMLNIAKDAEGKQ